MGKTIPGTPDKMACHGCGATNGPQDGVSGHWFCSGCLHELAAWALAAHYLVPIGFGLLVPAGTFCFALSFTVADYLRRWHGLRATVAAFGLGFVASVTYSLLFGGGVGRIALAGLIALAASSLVDLAAQTVTLRWRIWRYVLASNAVSLAVDTVVFTTIAFAALPADVRWHIMAGQYVAKIGMTVVAIPLVYAARSWAARSRATPAGVFYGR